MKQSKLLYAGIVGFGLGVVLRSSVDLGIAFTLFIMLLAVVLTAFSFVRSQYVFVAIALLFLSLGLFRADIAFNRTGDPGLLQKVGTHVQIDGEIVAEPDVRDTHQRLVVLTSQGRLLVLADLFPEFTYGERVHVQGELRRPNKFETDTGRTFNYPLFLAKDDIFLQVSFAEVEKLGGVGGNPVKRVLFGVKGAFLERVGRVIPDPQVSLLGGLVVGAKEALGNELNDAFRRTGIIHIVVLSGYNVTIVAKSIMASLDTFLPKMVGFGFGSVAIVFFAIMTGASATIVRASIMALLVILAQATGRTYVITRALFIAGFLMVLHNPYILLHDPSFQLSFLATIGLIHVAPHLEKYVLFLPKTLGFREVATATVATQLFVLPLLLYMTGELSLVALPVNLLVLFAVPATMLFGFLAGAVGFISTILSLPFAWVAYALLSYELFIIQMFDMLLFASVTLPNVPLWLVVALYAVFIALLLRFRKEDTMSV